MEHQTLNRPIDPAAERIILKIVRFLYIFFKQWLWFHSVWLLILLQYWRHKLWPSSSSHANWRNFFLCCVNWALVAQVNLYKSDVESFIMKEKRQLPSKEESIEFVCRVLGPGLKISGKFSWKADIFKELWFLTKC